MSSHTGLLKQEKKQIVWASRLLMFFLRLATQKDSLSSEEELALQKWLKTFIQETEDKSSSELAVLLNQQIEKANRALKEKAMLAKYAPFPKFSYYNNIHAESAILDQIDMVERTLSEMAQAEILEWSEESLFFSNLLKIFTKIENKTLEPKEGIALLALQMEKINEKLPSDFQLPVPELSSYDY